jgi:anti-sigma-K factor RskA
MPDLFGGEERRAIERKRDSDDSFQRFWERYPRKVNRIAAVKAWNKLRPSPELVARILEALEWQVEQWEDPQYTPHASSYLNNERWNDERPQPKPKAQMSGAAATVFRVLGGKAS